MTAPRLQKVRPEDVTLLTATTGPPQGLGSKPVIAYTPGTTHRALVTPLTAEQAVKAGLLTHVSRWRVRFPAGVFLKPEDRVRFRGKDWKALTVVLYPSYTLVTVEGV